MWQLDRASHYIAGIVRWIRSHSKAACYLISHRLLASYVQTVTEEISDYMRKSLGPVGLFNSRYRRNPTVDWNCGPNRWRYASGWRRMQGIIRLLSTFHQIGLHRSVERLTTRSRRISITSSSASDTASRAFDVRQGNSTQAPPRLWTCSEFN